MPYGPPYLRNPLDTNATHASHDTRYDQRVYLEREIVSTNFDREFCFFTLPRGSLNVVPIIQVSTTLITLTIFVSRYCALSTGCSLSSTMKSAPADRFLHPARSRGCFFRSSRRRVRLGLGPVRFASDWLYGTSRSELEFGGYRLRAVLW